MERCCTYYWDSTVDIRMIKILKNVTIYRQVWHVFLSFVETKGEKTKMSWKWKRNYWVVGRGRKKGEDRSERVMEGGESGQSVLHVHIEISHEFLYFIY
jgi:hypothetical protein